MEVLAIDLAKSPLVRLCTEATQGPIRFALRFEKELRPSTAKLLQFVSELQAQLEQSSASGVQWINDPRQEDWVFHFRKTNTGKMEVALELKASLWDERFRYRVADVTAASHPTVASLLAREVSLRVDPGGTVLDPFCGSGMELVELGLKREDIRLIGSDIDEQALQAARANADAAGLSGRVLWEQRSALDVIETRLGAVVTNPPFGRRSKSDDIVELLDQFIQLLPRVLKPGGCLVWISPQPKRTAASLAKNGIRVELRHPIQLGGMHVELQVARNLRLTMTR
jgi:tRNA (guanine6-N2)-methyltransferase